MAHHFAHCTILQSKCAKIIILEKIGWSKQIWISNNQTYSRKKIINGYLFSRKNTKVPRAMLGGKRILGIIEK